MSTSTPPSAPNSTAELLYLLHGDPADLADALSGMRGADIAEALRELKPDAAAKVLAALPFDLAVQVFDEPELVHERVAIIRQMDERAIGPLVDAMSADQQADLFRELPGQGPVPASEAARHTHTAGASTPASLCAGHRRRHHDDGVRLDAQDVDRRTRTPPHRRGRRREGDRVCDLRVSARHATARARRVAARSGARRTGRNWLETLATTALPSRSRR